MSYIPFGQDKAVIKTGNASIQVIHIVWDSISKLRSNRSLLVSTYDVIFTSVTISNFIYHCHNYVFACQNKKSKIYQELANFCEISLFICFICFSYYIIFIFAGGRVGVRGRMVVGFSLPMQSVLITSEVVRSNPTHGEVYLIQHCVIKFVSDLRQVGGFLWVLWFPSPIKLSATI
jgi:hypothetical protein